MPCDYARYPADWPQIRERIVARAQGRCEWCDLQNGQWVMRDPDTPSERVVRIVLTIAHLDHDVTNNDPSNLRALCQRCHLNHDRARHLAHAAETRRQRQRAAGQAELAL